jgi:hypothetical protein
MSIQALKESLPELTEEAFERDLSAIRPQISRASAGLRRLETSRAERSPGRDPRLFRGRARASQEQ